MKNKANTPRRDGVAIPVKYPRTPHLPWSAGAGRDDLVLKNCDHFKGRRVAITEKMDGENTTMYRDHIHARSLHSRNHPSRNWVKNLHGQIRFKIPGGWRVCGENLYAKHSIHYQDLPDYFLVFGIYDDAGWCLPWEETVKWCGHLGLTHISARNHEVRAWDAGTEEFLGVLANRADASTVEGYVVSLADGFAHEDFGLSVAKNVRANHVQTDGHWMSGPVVKNLLKESK